LRVDIKRHQRQTAELDDLEHAETCKEQQLGREHGPDEQVVAMHRDDNAENEKGHRTQRERAHV